MSFHIVPRARTGVAPQGGGWGRIEAKRVKPLARLGKVRFTKCFTARPVADARGGMAEIWDNWGQRVD